MTQPSEFSKWRSEFMPSVRKAVIGLTVTAIIAGSVSFASGAWRNIVALWHLPARVEDNHEAIQRLRIPSKIFEISERSGPVHGLCIGGEPCPMNIRVRRTREALSCRIVPGSVAYYYRNPRTNEVYDVQMVDGRPRDIGTAYINLAFTFTTPRGLAPDAELCVEPAYTGCPGQAKNSPPAKQAPECFNVPVADTRP